MWNIVTKVIKLIVVDGSMYVIFNIICHNRLDCTKIAIAVPSHVCKLATQSFSIMEDTAVSHYFLVIHELV